MFIAIEGLRSFGLFVWIRYVERKAVQDNGSSEFGLGFPGNDYVAACHCFELTPNAAAVVVMHYASRRLKALHNVSTVDVQTQFADLVIIEEVMKGKNEVSACLQAANSHFENGGRSYFGLNRNAIRRKRCPILKAFFSPIAQHFRGRINATQKKSKPLDFSRGLLRFIYPPMMAIGSQNIPTAIVLTDVDFEDGRCVVALPEREWK